VAPLGHGERVGQMARRAMTVAAVLRKVLSLFSIAVLF